MKHLALFLCLLWLVPVCGLCETILWEDEAGQVILGDDGNVQFISPDGEAADENFFVPTAVPAETPAPIEAPAQVEAPAPIEPIDFTFKGTLKYGDSGERVAQLQTRLSELGFYTAKVSGGYYKVTKAAVKAFQAHNGLSADGIAGRDTQELLFSAAAVPAEATPRPSPTPEPAKYTLMVDVANQITRAYTYDEDGQYTVLVREMICSTGTSKYPTPCKTTIMPKKRARWGYFPTWGSHAQYLTRIDAANAFHSVLYSEPNENTLSVKSFDALGTPASHGCVRLLVSDAKWIYENCKEGTIITVYEGDYDPEYTMTLKPTLNASTLRENPLPAPTATPAYAPENWPTQYRTLSRGKKGEDVYMLQMRLTELGYLREEPFMADMFVLMGNALMDEAIPPRAKELLAGFDVNTPTAEVVRRGQREGSIREGDPVALSVAFWAAVQGIAEELAVYPDMPCPEPEWIVDIVRKR